MDVVKIIGNSQALAIQVLAYQGVLPPGNTPQVLVNNFIQHAGMIVWYVCISTHSSRSPRPQPTNIEVITGSYLRIRRIHPLNSSRAYTVTPAKPTRTPYTPTGAPISNTTMFDYTVTHLHQ